MHTLRVSAAARLPKVRARVRVRAITLTLTLTLALTLTLTPAKDVVSLHLELHPLITARAQRTATMLRSADALRLGYSEKLEVLVGTPAADTLLRALQVRGRGRGRGRVRLGLGLGLG